MGHLGLLCKVRICGLISVTNLPGVVGLRAPIFQGPTAIEEISGFPWAQGIYRVYGGPRRRLLGPATMSPFGALIPATMFLFGTITSLRWEHRHLVLLCWGTGFLVAS